MTSVDNKNKLILNHHIQYQIKLSQIKNGLTAEEIKEKNKAYRRKHYAEGKANGAPFYCSTLIKKRCLYWKKLQETLSQIDFFTRLARLKLRNEPFYNDVCEFLNI